MDAECKDSAGLVDVPGFRCNGVACDVRGTGDDRLDLALIYSERPCQAAGVFTTNDVKAAPVILCERVLAKGGPVHGIVANSGNANACTGDAGMRDAESMAAAAARACGVGDDAFLVCSTGRIGRALPLPRLLAGIGTAAGGMDTSADHGQRAARAILTSDTRAKAVSTRFQAGGKWLTVAGIAKGAGMIEPHMATMLAFLATDAALAGDALRTALGTAVDTSFNAISVDGDMSTNDTVLLLANGASGVEITAAADRSAFQTAVSALCRLLAEKIVGDGERVTKLVELHIKGAADRAAAEKVARAVGNSLLVKTSWFGEDPNWGRLLDAAGYARVGLRENLLDVYYGDVPVMRGGRVYAENQPLWKKVVEQKRFSITMDLHLGAADYRFLSTDLSTGYVEFNKSE